MTNIDFIQYLSDQLSDLEEITFRKMMGEYIIYYKGKIIGDICDNRLLVKIVPSSLDLMPNAPHEPPYKGAKAMLLVENLDDRQFLSQLIKAMYLELPEPKKH